MGQLHSKTIEGREVSFGKISAVDGWRILHRLTKVVSPIFDGLAKGTLGGAVSDAMSKMSEDELLNLIRSLTADVLVDGKKWSNDDLADYGFTVLVITEAVRYNFGGFFSPIIAGLNASKAKAAEMA